MGTLDGIGRSLYITYHGIFYGKCVMENFQSVLLPRIRRAFFERFFFRGLFRDAPVGRLLLLTTTPPPETSALDPPIRTVAAAAAVKSSIGKSGRSGGGLLPPQNRGEVR